ncbi:hypothetical protein E1J24_05590 [Xanthomonas hortorum pv. pelargonii]|uniref:Uncharacterized protein n=1 Tax=Xanthomonas hortorum pv. pelargonii TaxID=453602 RepID=A0AAW9ZMZ0_9XANT|nr:hypothetical protein [Xanthomonas hortorum pv. pelargonii]
MQALSQLSYGPAVLRAGNHSDIESTWEVIRRKKFAGCICRWMHRLTHLLARSGRNKKHAKKSPGSAEAFR